ncbi:MAG: PEP-CTERM sorting domain-containing protein [Akkermansiaceae bacterium]
MTHTKTTRWLLTALATFTTLAGQANATVVIDVIIDTTSGIVVMRTSTGNSDVDATTRIGTAGITIENFFTSNVTYNNTVIIGTLTSATLSPIPPGSKTYSRLGTFDYNANDGAFKAGNDLSVYKNSGDNPNQVFTTSTQAFVGESSVDFSATPSALPTIGTTGNVISGFWNDGRNDVNSGQHSRIIGQWSVVQVIPEPSTTALLGLGGLALMLRRRR